MSFRCTAIVGLHLLLATLPPTGLLAQGAVFHESRLGDRVRITFPDTLRRPVVGVLRESSSDSLIVVSPRVIHRIPADEVGTLEVSIQRKSQSGKGLATGFLLGTAGGLGLGLVTGAGVEPCEGWGCLFYCDAACHTWGGILLGAVVGTTVGLIAGAGTKKDVWAPASKPSPGTPIARIIPVVRSGAESTLLVGARIRW